MENPHVYKIERSRTDTTLGTKSKESSIKMGEVNADFQKNKY